MLPFHPAAVNVKPARMGGVLEALACVARCDAAGVSVYFGGMSGVNYGLFGFLWMKGKFDRSQNWQLPPQTVQLMLMWMVLCYTGLLGPVANYAHTAGLLIGMLLGIASARLVPFLERDSR